MSRHHGSHTSHGKITDVSDEPRGLIVCSHQFGGKRRPRLLAGPSFIGELKSYDSAVRSPFPFKPKTAPMAEYFAFQAALCFSVAHILVRRGLVNSNALTGSVVSLATSAAAFWMLLPFFVPLSALWVPAIGYFIAAGLFA